MALLALAAALVAPHMASFFRGRSLDQEARRLLALTHYGRSRAIAEGVPVLLWIHPADSSYGLEIQPGYTATDDDHAVSCQLDRDLGIETTAATEPAPYSDDVDPVVPVDGILFNPDGLVDPSSVTKIVIRQTGEKDALALVASSDGLDYELLPEDAPPAS